MKETLSCLTIDLNKAQRVVRKYALMRAEFDATTIKIMDQGYAQKMSQFFSGYSLEGLKELNVDQSQYTSLINSHTKIVKREMEKFDLTTASGMKKLIDYIDALSGKSENYQKALTKMREEVTNHNKSEEDGAKKWGTFYANIKAISNTAMSGFGAFGGTQGSIISNTFSIFQEMAVLQTKHKLNATLKPESADMFLFKSGLKIGMSLMGNAAFVGNLSKKSIETVDMIKNVKSFFIDTVFTNLEMKENVEALK